jgi:hypothetical protein
MTWEKMVDNYHYFGEYDHFGFVMSPEFCRTWRIEEAINESREIKDVAHSYTCRYDKSTKCYKGSGTHDWETGITTFP